MMSGVGEQTAVKKRVSIREDFLTSPLTNLEAVRLKGSRCRSCGEVFLGQSAACENCTSTDLEAIVLTTRGKLYTYTVLRHRPPGGYLGPDPFVPFPVGLIELPEGVRIISVLKDCDEEKLQIDAPMDLVVEKLGEDAEGNELISFKFRPAKS